MDSIIKYKDYMKKSGDRYGLFKLLNDNFTISTATYPGSYIDITPSFFFPNTYYIDIDKKAKKFFTNEKEIINYIEDNKTYDDETNFSFFPEDYRKKFDDIIYSSDLLISLYAGFISKYCKDLLKNNGLLLANNSHGDASMAKLDKDFTFIGIINYQNKKYYLKRDNLDDYFIPNKNINVTKGMLEKTNRGLGYTKPASYYLFRKK
jgi:hypothetical protein